MKSSLALYSVLPLVTGIPFAHNSNVDYPNHKVCPITSGDNATAIPDQDELMGLTYVTSPNAVGAKIHVAPKLPARLQARNVVPQLMKGIFGNSFVSKKEKFGQYTDGKAWFNSYHLYKDHLRFLSDLQRSLPSNSEIFTAGYSYEGNPIQGIRIWGSRGINATSNVVIHGGVHAREWISSSTAQYFAFVLIHGYGKEPSITRMVDERQFEIIPSCNPDGLIWTQEHDRMWRKNRQPFFASPLWAKSWIGRDNNRNWAHKWDVSRGASRWPFEELYRGVKPADSPENRALQSHMLGLGTGTYAYTCTPPSNRDRQMELLDGLAAAIEAVYGTRYTTGLACETFEKVASGTAIDWAKDVGGARYSFVLELRDEGVYDFLLPADQILPTGFETFAGLKNLLDNI